MYIDVCLVVVGANGGRVCDNEIWESKANPPNISPSCHASVGLQPCWTNKHSHHSQTNSKNMKLNLSTKIYTLNNTSKPI